MHGNFQQPRSTEMNMRRAMMCYQIWRLEQMLEEAETAHDRDSIRNQIRALRAYLYRTRRW
jgi:hypothetical protein